jgi:hypothetical protein
MNNQKMLVKTLIKTTTDGVLSDPHRNRDIIVSKNKVSCCIILFFHRRSGQVTWTENWQHSNPWMYK